MKPSGTFTRDDIGKIFIGFAKSLCAIVVLALLTAAAKRMGLVSESEAFPLYIGASMAVSAAIVALELARR